jgi:hypothetical protein
VKVKHFANFVIKHNKPFDLDTNFSQSDEEKLNQQAENEKTRNMAATELFYLYTVIELV